MKSPQETILTLLIIGARFQLTRTLFPIFQLDIIQTNWNCHLVYPSGSKLSFPSYDQKTGTDGIPPKKKLSPKSPSLKKQSIFSKNEIDTRGSFP